MDAAMKFARQFFLELPKPQYNRTKFIARRQSYHGTTLGPLSLSGHVARRALFEPLLMENCSHVSPCYAYRDTKDGESTDEYVKRLAQELDSEFQRLGPETVCAFVAEPVVGAVSFTSMDFVNLLTFQNRPWAACQPSQVTLKP
jgi:adenosylmethionine-8-amino-7-oxononanoate aminotransferase